jgi:hypothetical protein
MAKNDENGFELKVGGSHESYYNTLKEAVDAAEYSGCDGDDVEVWKCVKKGYIEQKVVWDNGKN